MAKIGQSGPKVRVETWIGGVLAFVTLAAATWRYLVSPQTPADFLTAVISVGAPLLTLILLVVTVRSLRAMFRARDESFAATLDRELEEWQARMEPLVRVKNDYEGAGDQDGAVYEMLVEHDHVLKKGEDLGDMPHVQFLRLPSTFEQGAKIVFLFRKSMFERRAAALDEDPMVTTQKVAKDFAIAVGQTFHDLVAVHAAPDAKVSDRVVLTVKHPLRAADDAHRIVHLVNYATLLYLAIA